jgi:hypothetical protein
MPIDGGPSGKSTVAVGETTLKSPITPLESLNQVSKSQLPPFPSETSSSDTSLDGKSPFPMSFESSSGTPIAGGSTGQSTAAVGERN